ncbi:MAG TPA: AMP-binding protein, partial [Pyrinomonadaceae bacterium]|nr:AMP-binding protein [Pyrinomonadaceae bacterium]
MSTSTSFEAGRAPRPLADVATLTELLRRRALQEPGRTGYTFLADGEGAEVTLTYGELDARARSVAALLQELKAGGGRVLLLYPSGLEYVAAFFGCLYAGAAAVPAYPPKLNRHLSRVRAVVSDARAEVALTTAAVLARVGRLFEQAPDLRRLRWLTTDDLDAARADEWREPRAAGGDLAFLQYTSGSTSTAKGVMVTHDNLLRNERMIESAFGQTPASITVGWLPLYHDMGLIGNVLQPLYTGTPCVLMSPTSFLQRPARWLSAITRYRATTSGGPNFAYDLCAERIGPEERRLLDLSSWDVAYNGSEPVRADTLERFARAFAPCGFRPEAFLPCYGLAEATLLVSGKKRAGGAVLKTFEAGALERHRAVEARDGGEAVRRLVGCGEPAPGQKVLIVDPDTRAPRPPGRVGEVWVSGANVARGYWGRPEESGEVFGARLAGTGEGPFLRTGDLGFVSGGELFVTGRLKDLIIIRGLNHYPQDIERTAGSSHPALRPGGGAAFSIEVGGEERLVVVQEVAGRRHPDLPSAVEAIRQAVAEEHEIRAHGVTLVRAGELPRTSSGKVRRRDCRSLYLSGGFEELAGWRAGDGPASVASATEPPGPEARGAESAARWLRAQFAARLKTDPSRIDIDRPISGYGLDSLEAIELAHALETQLGVRLSLSDFLRSPSIAELAELAAAPPPAPPAKDIRVRTEGAAAAYPLSRNQQSIWFMQQLAPGGAAYNITRAARIRSPLDVEALGAALRKLTRRHASLRTTFDALRGGPVQWVHDSAAPCLFTEDASRWDEARLARRLDEEAARPFDLERGPLLRVCVFSLSPHDHVLLLAAHHIIVDFWSLATLLRELGQLYSAERAGAAADLPPLARDYTDYVSRQEEMLSGAAGERLWQYWRRQLAGELPPLDLPADRRRPPAQTYRGASHAFRLPPGLVRDIRALGRAHEATLYMTLLAAYQVLLHRYTGQTELVVGSPTTGRSRAEFKGVVGYFVNPLALRATLSGEQPFSELLGQVRRVVLSAFEHEEYPFAQLVERLQPARHPGRAPLFQTMFVLQTAPSLDRQNLASLAVCDTGARIEWAGHTLEPVELRHRISQFDLTLTLAESGEGLSASFEYSTDLFDATTIRRMSDNFGVLLAGVVADPAARLSELPLLTDEERRRLLVEFNDTARDYPRHLCVHQLFEQQVRRTPHSVALTYEGEGLTYAELNARANRLARCLRRRGVGPDSRVALMLERSFGLVVSLLAVLKAGGAYVPLDPDYPRERLSFMLADSAAALLLTDSTLRARLPGPAPAPALCLDGLSAELAGESDSDPRPASGPAHLAYLIYTSGSTGRPKGVMVTHAALSNHMLWMLGRFPLSGSDSVLLKTPVSFDASVWEFFAPLLSGARLLAARAGGHRDAGYLAGLVGGGRVT